MEKAEWHERYIKYLQRRAGLTRTEAEDTLNAGMGDHDYDDSPEDSAEEEISYWTDD